MISTLSRNILSFSNSVKGKYVVFCISEFSNPIVTKLSSFKNRSSLKDLSTSGLSHDSVFQKIHEVFGRFVSEAKLLCGKFCSKDWQLITATVLVLLGKVKPLQTMRVLHERYNHGTKRFSQDSISLIVKIQATVKVQQECLAWLSKPTWRLYVSRLKSAVFAVHVLVRWELARMCMVTQQSICL